MALSDPQSIKINGVSISLPRVSTRDGKSVYSSADGLTKLAVSTQETGKRKRQVIRLDQKKIAADPFMPVQNKEVSDSVYLVIDRPEEGYSNEEAKKQIEGLVELLSASTFSLPAKVLGGES